MDKKQVVIIGGGASGMMAAYAAADAGHRVILLERNEKLGKKLYITGKGRCNLTNACQIEEMLAQVMSNRRFLYSAFYTCTNEWVMDFFQQHGVKLKVERGNRVFPVSDHSSDIIAALRRALDEKRVEVRLNTRVESLLYTEKSVVAGVLLSDGQRLKADHVIIATGGRSYASTGSTGDGYRFAEESGHQLTAPSPSLVPMCVQEDWVRMLQGLSLKNTAIRITNGRKVWYEDFGEMLFTHFGVSGPMILSASAAISPAAFDEKLTLLIDLKPALDEEQLDRRVLRDFEEMHARAFKNALGKLFPAKLIPVMVQLSGISPEKCVSEITREERRRLVHLTKHLAITITGLRGFDEAIVTKGGVSVCDVDPSTMRSKKIQGLSFCGEVLDLDAQTGGYNLQIAWSTGYLAGSCV